MSMVRTGTLPKGNYRVRIDIHQVCKVVVVR